MRLKRLETLEANSRRGEGLCVVWPEDETAGRRYTFNGQPVDAEMFAQLAPGARAVIVVRYEDEKEPNRATHL